MMEQERYSILYSSPTGNTKMLAEAIQDALPKEDCDYFGPCKEVDSDMLYIGFWTEKGNADHLTIDFLNKLKNKKIFFHARIIHSINLPQITRMNTDDFL